MEEPGSNLWLQSPGVQKHKQKATLPKEKPAKKAAPLSDSVRLTKKGTNGKTATALLRSSDKNGTSNRKSSMQSSTSPDGFLSGGNGTPVTQKRSLGKQSCLSSFVTNKRPESSPLAIDRSLGTNKARVLPRAPSTSSLGVSSRNWRHLAWDGSISSSAAAPKGTGNFEYKRIGIERRKSMPDKLGLPQRLQNDLVKTSQQQKRKTDPIPGLQSPKRNSIAPSFSHPNPKLSPATPFAKQATTKQFFQRPSLGTKTSSPLESPRREKSLLSSKVASMENIRSPVKRTNTTSKEENRGRDIPKSARSLPRAASSIGLASNGAVVGGRRSVRRCKSDDLELMAHSSMQDRTGFEARPSILKNSTDQKRTLRDANFDGAVNPPRRSTKARFLATAATMSDDDDSIEEVPIKFDDGPERSRSRSPRPGLISSKQASRPRLTKTRSGLLELSGDSFKSSRTLMSQDKEDDFPDDPIWKKILRYLRILAPTVDERKEKKRIRIYIWCTLCLDFIAALVSLTTYHGVPTCCGVPIFSLTLVNFNWTKAIRITTYLYIAMIFAEIIPVVRKGLPFNILNPMVGFTITIAMFFDDRIVEAVCMWIIEFAAICFEFLVYSLERKLYHERYDRLEELQKDLNPYMSRRSLTVSTKSRSLRSSNSSRRLKISSNHSSDEDSASGHSFEDGENDVEGQVRDSSGLGSSNNHKLREARLLRERRMLRERQAGDRTRLRYHLAGVIVNIGLICISLTLTIVIASSGGLCIRTDYPIKVFDMNQLDRCSACRGQIINGKCEICNDEENFQCYYQYL